MSDISNWIVAAKNTEAREYAETRKDVFSRFVALNGALAQAHDAIRQDNTTAARRHINQAIWNTEGVAFTNEHRELLDDDVNDLAGLVIEPRPSGVTPRRWANLGVLVARFHDVWRAEPIDWDTDLHQLTDEDNR